jgi:hypothetical protein
MQLVRLHAVTRRVDRDPMRATRWSIWLTAPFMPGHIPPAMVVMRAQDMTVPPEEVGRPDGTRGLVIEDIWEMPDGPLEAAIAQAMVRSDERAEAEAHMATLYHWTVSCWRIVKPGGQVIGERPMPLTHPDLTTVLQQLAEHPDYQQYRVTAMSAIDGTLVSLNQEGRVVVDHNPGGTSQ